jgi:hypothetical protein
MHAVVDVPRDGAASAAVISGRRRFAAASSRRRCALTSATVSGSVAGAVTRDSAIASPHPQIDDAALGVAGVGDDEVEHLLPVVEYTSSRAARS